MLPHVDLTVSYFRIKLQKCIYSHISHIFILKFDIKLQKCIYSHTLIYSYQNLISLKRNVEFSDNFIYKIHSECDEHTSIEFNIESSGAGRAPCHFSHGFHETLFNYRVIMYYSPKGGGIATDSSNI